MSEPARIADQLHQALEGDPWHGPSLRVLLEGVTAVQASAHPIPSAHSIWELVLHLTSWTNMARRRLAAREQIEMDEAQNFPVPAGSWEPARDALFTETRLLIAEIAALTPDALDEFLYRLLHGTVQHHLYHGGQIALLRKSA